MLKFRYEARDPKTGELVSANIESASEQEAVKSLRAQGLTPLNIKPSEGFSLNPIAALRGRIKAKDHILFARQLSTLINAGLPLIQSLRSVSEQTESKALVVVINNVMKEVEAGSALSIALQKYPRVFNRVFCSLVAAGEASGTLDKALERIATQQEKDADIISKIRGALAYPIIVLLVMVGVIGFMVVKVLPQVEEIYKGLSGVKLPPLTIALLAVSHFVINFWWVVIIVLVLLVFFTTRFARSGPGKLVVDKIKMRAWPFGGLFMKVYMARFARTATTLVSSGVPLLQVIDIVAQAVNNVHIEASLHSAADKVKGGTALSAAIDKDPNFLPLVSNMLRIGEQSGAIEQMLDKIAEYYEKEVDNEIKTVSSIIEPVMMVLLGVVAFILVAAILLPIYGLAGQATNIGTGQR